MDGQVRTYLHLCNNLLISQHCPNDLDLKSQPNLTSQPDCPQSCVDWRPDVTPGKGLDDTCECGESYYNENGKWIRGIDVRAGSSPPKAEST